LLCLLPTPVDVLWAAGRAEPLLPARLPCAGVAAPRANAPRGEAAVAGKTEVFVWVSQVSSGSRLRFENEG